MERQEWIGNDGSGEDGKGVERQKGSGDERIGEDGT